MSELKELKAALTNAVESAVKNYLIDHAGEDLPDDQLTLESYRFEVSRLDNLQVSVRAKAADNPNMPAHYFTIKVSGS